MKVLTHVRPQRSPASFLLADIRTDFLWFLWQFSGDVEVVLGGLRTDEPDLSFFAVSAAAWWMRPWWSVALKVSTLCWGDGCFSWATPSFVSIWWSSISTTDSKNKLWFFPESRWDWSVLKKDAYLFCAPPTEISTPPVPRCSAHERGRNILQKNDKICIISVENQPLFLSRRAAFVM